MLPFAFRRMNALWIGNHALQLQIKPVLTIAYFSFSIIAKFNIGYLEWIIRFCHACRFI